MEAVTPQNGSSGEIDLSVPKCVCDRDDSLGDATLAPILVTIVDLQANAFGHSPVAHDAYFRMFDEKDRTPVCIHRLMSQPSKSVYQERWTQSAQPRMAKPNGGKGSWNDCA